MSFSKQDDSFEQKVKEYLTDVVPKDEILVDVPLEALPAEKVDGFACKGFDSGDDGDDEIYDEAYGVDCGADEGNAAFKMPKTTSTGKEKPPHAGHRARLFAKYKNEYLTDSEFLELLLFYAIPRRNTNDIAHALLAKYGSLRAVLSADDADLKKITGVGDSALAFLKHLNELCIRYRVDQPLYSPLTSKTKYEDFWKELDQIYADEQCEVVDVYLLDSDSQIFNSRRLAVGGVSSVEFQPPLLSKILLEMSPAGIVIVHNHPSGGTQPSAADKAMTEKCQVLCSLHNVMFCDHVIYGGGQKYSYYDSGKLQPISVRFSIENIVVKKEAKTPKK